jgi:hypothetical protein
LVYYWGTLFRLGFFPGGDMWSYTSSTFGSPSSTSDVNWQLGTCKVMWINSHQHMMLCVYRVTPRGHGHYQHERAHGSWVWPEVGLTWGNAHRLGHYIMLWMKKIQQLSWQQQKDNREHIWMNEYVNFGWKKW